MVYKTHKGGGRENTGESGKWGVEEGDKKKKGWIGSVLPTIVLFIIQYLLIANSLHSIKENVDIVYLHLFLLPKRAFLESWL